MKSERHVLTSLKRYYQRIPRIAWIGLYLILVIGALSLLFTGWAYDDPFITYRYAENLSRGLGLTYNPGEIRLSTTTPLFALLLAALHPLWPDLPNLAVIIGACSMAAGGLFLWDFLYLPGFKYARWAGLLFYPLFPLVTSTLGSETPLYLAFCLGAFASYRRQHCRLAALSAALAVLTRPDGALIAVILGLHYICSHPPQKHQWRLWIASLPRQSILIYILIGSAWLIYAWATYGSPIPLTLFAKQQQALVAGSQAFLPGLRTIMSWYSSWFYQLLALLALPGLALGLLRSSALRWLAAWTLLYFIAYSLLGVTRYFWYYAPLVPLFLAGFGWGLEGIADLLKLLLHKVRVPNVAAVALHTTARLLPVVILLFLLLLQAGKLWNQHLRPDARYPIYRAAGEWLRQNTPANASVGTLEVGIIGYYARRPMIDFSGLIQPDIAVALGQTGSYAAAAYWAVTQYTPDVLVLQQGLFPEIESTILSHCQLEISYPGADYDYAFNLGIYTCPPASG